MGKSLRERAARAGRRNQVSPDVCRIRVGDEEYCIDPLDDVFSVLGSKWSLLVIAVVGNQRVVRFVELQKALAGISPRTLTDRLKALEGAGLLVRTVYPEVPLRVEYALTAKGEALRTALLPLLAWAERYL